PVKRVLTSIPSLFPQAHAEYCQAGQKWNWDGVDFQVLNPQAGSVYQDNNSSCILQIGPPGSRTLLTGDIEAAVEQDLVARYGQVLAAQILQVPHHGSKTSSTLDFLQQVQPKYALFSEGYFNRFHFPAPAVLQRYQSMSSISWLTSVNGAIKIKVNPHKPLIVITAARANFTDVDPSSEKVFLRKLAFLRYNLRHE
ncbi:MAG: hypothetical protein JSR33_11035, partial [Proteobacteria bacterium]|nr:hypothetical protein [Pseudomonadota bacterium]